MKTGETLYNDICFELTNFENSDDQETTIEEWSDVFYSLLCRVQNAIDIGALIYNEEFDSRHPYGENTTICGADGCEGCILRYGDIQQCKQEAARKAALSGKTMKIASE